MLITIYYNNKKEKRKTHLSLSHCVCQSVRISACRYIFCCVQLKQSNRERERENPLIILAGLRALSRLGGGLRRRKVKIKVMEWWHKMVFPVRRAWLAVYARIKARKNGAGLLKLHDDIQTCGYEDVQIMWEMLRRTESEIMPNHTNQKQRWFFRNFTCSNNGSAAVPSFSMDQTHEV